MDPETEGGGGFMSQRWFGMPAPVVIIGVALLAYFLFFRNSGGIGQGSSAGGSDTLTTGNTTVESGAVRVVVNAGNNGEDNDQPKPPHKGITRTVTVPDVVGKPGEAARDAIMKAGLRARQIPARTPAGKPTVVVSENPRGGGKARKGSVVTTHVRTEGVNR